MSSDLKLILPFEVSNTIYNGREYIDSRGTTRNEKYPLGSFDDRDMMIWSKDQALEPCNWKSSHQRLGNQMHNHKAHVPLKHCAKSPQKKKKLDQYMNNGKFITNFELDGEIYGNEKDKSQRIQSSLLLSSPLTKEKWVILEETQGHDARLAANHTIECCRINTEDYSHLSDSDDSILRPNPLEQGNLKRKHKDLKDSRSNTSNSKTSIKVKANTKLLKAILKPLNEVFVDSSETSLSLNSKEQDMELNEPFENFLSSRGNHLPRSVIPLGPRFQVEVPKWEGTTNIKHHNDDEDLKWLGTQIWPILFMSTKDIENSRLNSCSCEFHESVHCVKKHINIERELLKLEIGKTHSLWKFDDMGEDVSKSWTLKEQKDFESLVKLYLLSNDTNFWKLVMEHFPSKSTKCMVSYYYNVYIPKGIRMETLSSFGAVNDDNNVDKDQNEKSKTEIECSSKGDLLSKGKPKTRGRWSRKLR